MLRILNITFAQISPLITDLNFIAKDAREKTWENEAFRDFLRNQSSAQVDTLIHALNEEVSATIDCTACGNCCRSFMINVTEEEANSVSAHLAMDVSSFKEKFLEVGSSGQMIVNSIPCHFLEGNICRIYENRFSECREFPHLHKPHVSQRLFGLLMYFGTCPIIYNVMEQAKKILHFQPAIHDHQNHKINSI